MSTMLYLITKALVSGVIIMMASEAAKRSPTYGALLISLPLVSILAMIWLWRDTGDNERIAALSEGTFWLVLPTLPMFLVVPAMLRHGFGFWPALGAACALTLALYLAAVWLLSRLGINF
jgi:F0F1-type ATP synthase assembly protein I